GDVAFVEVFDALPQDTDARRLLKPGHLVRLDAGELAAGVLAFGPVGGDGFQRDEGGETATDLENSARLEMPDRRIEELGIAGAEVGIVEIEAGARVPRELLEFGAVAKALQQGELFLDVHVDAGQR